MKLRTDFVTNSSSSSFLFEKGTDINELKKQVLARYEELDAKQDRHWRSPEFVESIRQREREFLQNFENEIQHFTDVDEWGLSEIYDWYGDDMLKKKLAGMPENKSQWSREVKRFVYLYSYIHFIFWWSRTEIPEIDICGMIDTVAVKDLFRVRYADCYAEDAEEICRYFIKNEFSELMGYFEEMAQKPVRMGELLEQYFECELVIYNGIQVEVCLADALAEAKECVYSCVHMG